jgi:hypothetical protein
MRVLPTVAKILSLALFVACAALLFEPRGFTSQSPQPAFVRGFIAASVGGVNFKTLRQGVANAPLEDIYIPNVRVTLRNLTTLTDSGPVTTDLSGRFTVRVPQQGRYRVCWEAKDFNAGCDEQIFSVQDEYENIGTLHIPLPRDEGRVGLYGSVTLADGSTPRSFDPLSNINAFATISVLDQNGATLSEVPVNNSDQYLFPSVPPGRSLQIRIREEGYDRKQPLQLGNPNIAAQKIDFSILNAPPRIEPLVALDGDKVRVSNAAPGQTVTLNARISDRDSDNLRFLWQVSSGTLSSTTDREPRWTLPSLPGNHSATLSVYDGKGGYATSSLNLTIEPSGLVFSGRVTGTDTPAIAGADVDVNGTHTVTDTGGFFRLHAPDQKRFVLTIRKPGYAFSSNIYYDAVVGGQWRLTKASVFHDVDPKSPIDLTNTRSDRECPGAPSEQLDWKANPALGLPQVQDGGGELATGAAAAHCLVRLPIVRQPRTQECPPGVKVEIPADSLVDAGGNAPTGKVDVQLSTVDLDSPGQMPGNYSVLMPNGRARAMQSYGAGIVEIYAGNTKYNLRSGAQATLVLPVDPSQLRSGGTIPSTIPLLTYDEARGVWLPDGKAKLQTVDGRRAYVATVTHFTAYNTDLIKTDQSCLAVQNQNMPPSYDLEVTIPRPGGAAAEKRLFHVTGGTSEIAILNLPKETNVVLVPIRPTDTDTDPSIDTSNLPMGVFVVNTGAPQNASWPLVPGGYANEPIGPPYFTGTPDAPAGPCSTKVILHDAGLQFYPARPPSGAFLHGLGSFAAVNISDIDPAFPADANTPLRDAVEQASQDYRNEIDPRGLRPTLPCFKVVNRMPLRSGESCAQHTGTGFTPQSALTETSAVYANTVDLGFGREMHCVRDGSNVACYVSNYNSLVYTGPGQGNDVAKAQQAVNGFNGTVQPDATVAMEFSKIEDHAANGTPVDCSDAAPVNCSDTQRVVKFYVFNQAGNPVNKANLDGYGTRPVPQLCMVCHGGFIPNPAGATSTTATPGAPSVHTPVFDSRTNVKLNAKFLPFDLRSFTYAAPDGDTGAFSAFTKANQQSAFLTLNQMVKVAPPPPSASAQDRVIEALYSAWYPGDATPQLENAPVPLWNTDPLHRDAYNNVVARSCRTCHVTNNAANLRFEQPGGVGVSGFDPKLGPVQSRVCKEHVMPHARRTHDLFWTSLNVSQPARLQVYGDVLNIFGWQKVGTGSVDPSLICGQEYTRGNGPPPATSAFTPVETIFSGSCVGCHNAGNAAPGSTFDVAGLDLSGAGAYGRIINFNSTELPSMKRVEFGVTTELNSYLWRKISNTHTGLGSYTAPGPGSAMPFGTAGLLAIDPTSAITIRDWIRNGAQP